jgi:hypothetical protein
VGAVAVLHESNSPQEDEVSCCCRSKEEGEGGERTYDKESVRSSTGRGGEGTSLTGELAGHRLHFERESKWREDEEEASQRAEDGSPHTATHTPSIETYLVAASSAHRGVLPPLRTSSPSFVLAVLLESHRTEAVSSVSHLWDENGCSGPY